MKEKWLLLITLVLALVLAIAIAGCASTPTPSPWVTSTSGSWTTFTTDDWLAGDVVMSVTQDNQGVLWVASTQGLTRFDGNHWEIYTNSPVKTPIICSARDKQGNLWFGTYGEGVFKYTGKKWQNFTPNNTSNGLPGIKIRDVFVDNEDNLWFATVGNVGQRTAPIDYGVTRYDGTDWTSFLDPYTGVVTIFQDSDGNMWFGTNAGVIRYDGSHWQTFTREDGLADNYVVAICQDNQGNMWFGTFDDGVSRYDGKNWRTFTPEDGMVSDAIHCMLKDSRENLWFGSYSTHGYYGISRFNGTQWQNFDPWRGKDDKYPPNYHYSVISIFQDNEGNLWFATSFGLVRYNPS
jgi:ligand-binding sensor domain-containing protein